MALVSDHIENCILQHEFSKEDAANFRSDLLAWYLVNRRKLPWRGDSPPFGLEEKAKNASKSTSKITSFFAPKAVKEVKVEEKSLKTSEPSIYPLVMPNPYATWVSEIMLQQTRVETVIGYFESWMRKFPTVQALANASLEDVNLVWAGLGYYRRARFLHEGAKQIALLPQFPSTHSELMNISGIGKYTAGAVLSIAFNEPAALVDGNVLRVLSRVRAVASNVKSKAFNEFVWKVCDKLVVGEQPGNFNQALMELGATICISDTPKCNSCPVSKYCMAYNSPSTKKDAGSNLGVKRQPETECSLCDIESLSIYTSELYPSTVKLSAAQNVRRFPLPAPKKKSPIFHFDVLFVTRLQGNSTHVLLVQRPSSGLLAGQWELPSVVVEDDSHLPLEFDQIVQPYLDARLLVGTSSKKLGAVHGPSKHIFSHVTHVSRVQEIKYCYDGSGTQINVSVPVNLAQVEVENDDSESEEKEPKKKPSKKSKKSANESVSTCSKWVSMDELDKLQVTTNSQKLMGFYNKEQKASSSKPNESIDLC